MCAKPAEKDGEKPCRKLFMPDARAHLFRHASFRRRLRRNMPHPARDAERAALPKAKPLSILAPRAVHRLSALAFQLLRCGIGGERFRLFF